MSTPETKQKSLFLNGVETESIEVGAEAIRIRATLPTTEEAQALATAIGGTPGYASEVPAIATTRDGVTLTLSLARKEPSR